MREERTGKLKIILDTNIWVSFAIGKHMEKLKEILYFPEWNIFICNEILYEVFDVLSRPKFKQYVKPSRISELREIIFATTIKVSHKSQVVVSRDEKDNYLLSLSKDVAANYLISGDKDLLVLENFEETRIVSFTQFLEIENV